jgi:hypothetical protein
MIAGSGCSCACQHGPRRVKRIQGDRPTVPTRLRVALGRMRGSGRSHLPAWPRPFTFTGAFSLKLPRRHTSLKSLPVKLSITKHRIAIVTVKGRSLSPPAQFFIDRVRTITKPLALVR